MRSPYRSLWCSEPPMKNLFLVIAGAVLVRTAAFAQEFSQAIEDNSFYIEEAYNQEPGVIQHIFTRSAIPASGRSDASVTEEWPLFGQLHQLSVTLPYSSSKTSRGIGDILFNYRYQATDENTLAVAPRISIIIPTGNKLKGLGNGVFGMQCNLPLSKRWSNNFVSHFNGGVTLLPNSSDSHAAAAQTTFFAGASGIFLMHKNFNIMLETLYSSGGGTDEFICSPGVRCAIDIGELQIVPGAAFPFFMNSTGTDHGFFVYLSFEHPY